MKRRTTLWFAIFCLTLLAQPSWGQNAKIAELEKRPSPKFSMPDISRTTLTNGLPLLFLQDTEFPVVRGYFYLRAGSLNDPAKLPGLSETTAQLLRIGGTTSLSPEAFDERLAELGAEITVQVEKEYVLLGFQCLSEDYSTVLGLFLDMLRRPRFDANKLAFVKNQLASGLQRQNDNPAQIVKREFPKLIYGSGNPWGAGYDSASFARITAEDVKSFYEKFYRPNYGVLAVSGDLSSAQAFQAVQKAAQDWPKAQAPLPVVAPLSKNWRTHRVLIAKPTDQTTLVLGHIGDKRFNPDKFALLLLNEILGGDTMTSRLGKKIRSDLGLSYGIYSRFGLEGDYGIFNIFVQTKAESTAQVIAETQKILEEVVAGTSLGESELTLQRDSLLNSLYASYEPRYNFVKEEARYQLLGYPPNYLESFRREIQKVTLADLKRVAKQYVKPEALSWLLVGDPKKMPALSGVPTSTSPFLSIP